MNKNTKGLLVAYFVVSIVPCLFGAAASATDKGTNWEGEIVDVACYVGLQHKDAQQGKCTKSCLLDGTPIGLATSGGDLYLLLENSDNKKPYQLAKQTPAQKVRVFGRTYTRGGMKVLTVDQLETLGQGATGCSDRTSDPGVSDPGYCGED